MYLHFWEPWFYQCHMGFNGIYVMGLLDRATLYIYHLAALMLALLNILQEAIVLDRLLHQEK